ncbi:MAG: CAP domain-containing protein [Chloroflexi bacterium]|nr:CAP domain-containing protein [Chloroflexota bacterium]
MRNPIRVTVFVIFMLLNLLPPPTIAAAGDQSAALISSLNQDRAAQGLPALTQDPRLTQVAQERASYLITHHFFSHCTGGESDPACPVSSIDLLPKLTSAGINVTQVAAGEDLALNNYFANYPQEAVAQTNQDWMNSLPHRSNILSKAYSSIGAAIVCCFTGVVNGQSITASLQASIVVAVFAGGPGLSSPAPSFANDSQTSCHFVLGFLTLQQMIPTHVGNCLENEQHNSLNGDALQQTTGGLLVWRKADNWTAFTDGYHTWVNGPYGLMERLNTQRFPWEANPQGLPVVPS